MPEPMAGNRDGQSVDGGVRGERRRVVGGTWLRQLSGPRFQEGPLSPASELHVRPHFSLHAPLTRSPASGPSPSTRANRTWGDGGPGEGRGPGSVPRRVWCLAGAS